jgi:hypothetical protein
MRLFAASRLMRFTARISWANVNRDCSAPFDALITAILCMAVSNEATAVVLLAGVVVLMMVEVTVAVDAAKSIWVIPVV